MQCVEDPISCRASVVGSPKETSHIKDHVSPHPATKPVDIDAPETNPHSNPVSTAASSESERDTRKNDNFDSSIAEFKPSLYRESVRDSLRSRNINVSDLEIYVNRKNKPAMILTLNKVSDDDENVSSFNVAIKNLPNSKEETIVQKNSSNVKETRTHQKENISASDPLGYPEYIESENNFALRSNADIVEYEKLKSTSEKSQNQILTEDSLVHDSKTVKQKVNFPKENNNLNISSEHLNRKASTDPFENKACTGDYPKNSLYSKAVKVFSPYKLKQMSIKSLSSSISKSVSPFCVARQLQEKHCSSDIGNEKSKNLAASENSCVPKPLSLELRSETQSPEPLECSANNNAAYLETPAEVISSCSDKQSVEIHKSLPSPLLLDRSVVCRRSVESSLLTSKSFDSSSLSFIQSCYSVLNLCKNPSNSEAGNAEQLHPKKHVGQGKQVWHVKSPEEMRMRTRSDSNVSEELSQTEEVSIPSRESFGISAEKKVGSSKSKKRKVDNSYKPSGISSGLNVSDIRKKFKQTTAPHDINSAAIYRLRGVRSDSALSQDSTVKDENLRLKNSNLKERVKTLSSGQRQNKLYKLSAIHSDSALNYSSQEKDLLDINDLVVGSDTLDNNRNGKTFRIKSIPYSQCLADKKLVQNSVKISKKKTAEIIAGKVRSKSFSEPSQHKYRKSLKFTDIFRSEPTGELTNSPLFGNMHGSIYSASSPSFLSHFIGGGDFDTDHNNSSLTCNASLTCDEQFFSDNFIKDLLPDFVEDPDLGNIENDIFELQEQYLKPADQQSPLPVFGTLISKLGTQERDQGNYVNRHEAVGSELTNMKQNQKVSITIAEDTHGGNWQRQYSQNHRNIPGNVTVENLPHVQTLLDRSDQISAIEPHVANNLNSIQVSQSSTPFNTAIPQRTIENLFASRTVDINAITTADALNSFIATSLGYQNLAVSTDNQSEQQASSVTQNLSNTSEYLGSISALPTSDVSQNYAVPHYQQVTLSGHMVTTTSERIQTVEEMFTKDVHRIPQSVMAMSSVVSQPSSGNIPDNGIRRDGSLTTTGHDV